MLIEMELREILTGSQVTALVLGEKEGGEREFPIYIGPYEAFFLEMAVNKKVGARPFTHDLIMNVLDGLGGTLRRVIVDKLVRSSPEEEEGGTFHGKLEVEKSDGTIVLIDTRPSDAMVLACKASVPVFVDNGVLDEVCRQSDSPEEDEE